ncbi:MAG: hypothetical protein KBD14_01155 [Candidatus Pacebacteria bacterium]|nr:hypothetical protein [Candidatus Paceibacterota bacterium]
MKTIINFISSKLNILQYLLLIIIVLGFISSVFLIERKEMLLVILFLFNFCLQWCVIRFYKNSNNYFLNFSLLTQTFILGKSLNIFLYLVSNRDILQLEVGKIFMYVILLLFSIFGTLFHPSFMGNWENWGNKFSIIRKFFPNLNIEKGKKLFLITLSILNLFLVIIIGGPNVLIFVLYTLVVIFSCTIIFDLKAVK